MKREGERVERKRGQGEKEIERYLLRDGGLDTWQPREKRKRKKEKRGKKQNKIIYMIR